ncbi:hypothetical protein G7046_g3407 [Stylonectria norvegica]|nr:hypothetical protein G7046_g3407 [Stylonectria norvegica]
MSLPIVFVCGVTGTQGGAVARYLRAKDVEVHAVARDPTSKNAKDIEALGVKLWHGGFDDEEALKGALEGTTAIFLNLSPDFADLSGELRQAKKIIAAGREAGVKHIVYSSGFTVSNPQKNKYWDPKAFTAHVLLTKQAIENETRAAGYETWTILRPGNFMANYLNPLAKYYDGLIEKGVWRTALEKTTQMPMVNTATIGEFSGAAILDPKRFDGQEISYCDEMITVDQIMASLSKATGRDIKAFYLPEEEVEAQKYNNPFIAGQLSMRDMAQFVDMDEVKTWGIPLKSFDEYLAAEKERVAETYLASA